MKKAIVTIAVLAVAASAAFAGVLVVPQFNDGGANVGGTFFPTAGSATFISIANNSASTKVITVNYYLLNGTANGIATFSMAAHQVASWRPVATDPAEASAIAPPTVITGPGSLTVEYDSTGGEMYGRVTVNAGGSDSQAFTQFGFALTPLAFP